MNNISVSFSQLDKRIKYICVFTRWTISFCTLKRRKSDRIVWQFVTEKIQGPSLLAARAESTLASRHRKLHAADNFTRRSRYIGVITIITSVFLPWFFYRTLWEVYYFFFFFHTRRCSWESLSHLWIPNSSFVACEFSLGHLEIYSTLLFLPLAN